MPDQIDLSYPVILELFPKYLAKERIETRAFLAWFLEHYYRLDEFAARGIFVANASRDANADQVLASQSPLVLYDVQELLDSYVVVGRSAPISSPITFDLFGYDVAEYHRLLKKRSF